MTSWTYVRSPTSVFSSASLPSFTPVYQTTFSEPSASYRIDTFLSEPLVHFQLIRCCGARWGCHLCLQLFSCIVRPHSVHAKLIGHLTNRNDAFYVTTVTMRPHLLETEWAFQISELPAFITFAVEAGCQATYLVPRPSEIIAGCTTALFSDEVLCF